MKYKSILLKSVTIFSIIYTLVSPYEIAYHTRRAISLCATSIFPSLFIFIVISKIASRLLMDINIPSPIAKIFQKVFYLNPSLIPVCLFGTVLGAPSSCYGITNIYKSGLCTKEEAESAIVLCGNCSWIFILGFVSSLFISKHIGILILISNTVSTFLVYRLIFKCKPNIVTNKSILPKKSSFSEIVTDSISTSGSDLFCLCGYIVFFFVTANVMAERLSLLLTRFCFDSQIIMYLRSFICMLFEMTTGVLHCSEISGYEKIILMTAATSFMGLSIMFQVKSVLNRCSLSAKKFILSKIICCVTGPLILIMQLLIVPTQAPVFKTQAEHSSAGLSKGYLIVLIFATVICFLASHIISKMDKKHKKQR